MYVFMFIIIIIFLYIFLLYYMFFDIFPFFLFFACNSAFEQGYLEPWRYINAFIIIIIIMWRFDGFEFSLFLYKFCGCFVPVTG